MKDSNEAKCQYLIKNIKNGLENLKDPKDFIEYSNNMQDAYKNIKKYNPSRKCNVLIVFDAVIADILSNKKINPIIAEYIYWR